MDLIGWRLRRSCSARVGWRWGFDVDYEGFLRGVWVFDSCFGRAIFDGSDCAVGRWGFVFAADI